MLETGVLLLFLAPGLAAFCALYGLFHTGKAIAPEPPAANSIQAAAIIAGASIVVHGVTATAFAIDSWWCAHGCAIIVPQDFVEPYGAAFRAINAKRITSLGVLFAMAGLTIQTLVTYLVVAWWLRRLARADALPPWIYSWAVDLANSLDNVDTALVAYVLTTTDSGGKAVAYGGLLNDLALRSDGGIARITLVECERYLVDLQATLSTASLSAAKSQFSFMAIDADQIRNVAFEALSLPPGPSSPRDWLTEGLARLYRART